MGYGSNEHVVIKTDNPELSAKLADTINNIGVFDWWKPPVQPSFNGTDPQYNDAEAVRLNDTTYPYSSFILKLWDKFSNDTTLQGYVTKTILGKDQSGTYDICRYDFTPQNYEKTIILGAALHGWENIGCAVLSRFMHHVCYDYKSYPQLNYIRNKVRVIIMPFENPYGYMNGGVRQNSNGVDLNRNFNYHWSDFTPSGAYDAKGSAANSEVETQYIVNTLNQFSSAIAYIDFHNMNKDANVSDFYFYDSAYEATAKGLATKIFAHFTEYMCVHDSNLLPNAFNYATRNNMYSCNPEFVKGAINPAMPHDSNEMTKWLEFAGNIILKYLELEKPTFTLEKEPFNISLYAEWAAGTGKIAPLNAYGEIDLPSYEFQVPCDGLVMVSHSVVFINTDIASRNFFTPLLGQGGTEFAPSQKHTQWEVYKDTIKANGRDCISFSASIPVKKTLGTIDKVKVGLYAYNNVGNLEISRVRINITFIPSFGKQRQNSLFWNGTQYAAYGFDYAKI